MWDSAAWAIGDGAPLHEARAPGAPAVPRTVRQGQVEPHAVDARAGRGSGGGLYAVHAEYEMFEHTYVVYRCAFCSAVRLFNLILQNYIKLSEQQDFFVRKVAPLASGLLCNLPHRGLYHFVPWQTL